MFKALDTRGFEGRTKWCAPSLVAMVTGLPLWRTHERFSWMAKEPNATFEGAWTEEIILILHEAGFRVRQLPAFSGTLQKYLKTQPVMDRARMVMACIPAHVLGLHYGFCFDNGHPRGVSIEEYKYRRSQLSGLYVIEKENA